MAAPIDTVLTDAQNVLLRVGNQVQGVGFRPFVYRLADEHGLSGWVQNTGSDVAILVQGTNQSIQNFIRDLIKCAPSIAKPVILESKSVAINKQSRFEIKPSEFESVQSTHIPVDYYTCADCLAELNNPNNRRFLYPFINCTQCGPRYTLIKSLPYDRPNTTMAGFELCTECKKEYSNLFDRRFHAEPIACPNCGPKLAYRKDDEVINDSRQALQTCIESLRAGNIVAIKGIGGYHLCCDALNESTIDQLRKLKSRPDKPLAVMVPPGSEDELSVIRQYVELSEQQAQSLRSPSRPIVLVKRTAACKLPETIAPGLDDVGVMLPYSPLHHLILNQLQSPIIATSANISGEPVLTEATEVEQRLGQITQHYLHHDRPIQRAADDTVIRIIANCSRPVRIGRGMAPLELKLPGQLQKPLIACGGHMKNTIALAWDNRIVISPHIGDLDAPRSLQVFKQTIADIQSLYKIEADTLVCDAHPSYASSRWARQQDKKVITVLHHTAHAAILAGEYPDEQNWLVFTWDAVGYGEDNTLWGGEALLGQPGRWQRVASWRPFYLPGGEKASRQPWRSALALCWEAGHDWNCAVDDTDLLHAAWQKKINCPQTTAVGRLFDAAAALIGVCQTSSYEGQAPMWLENLARQGQGQAIKLPLLENDDLIQSDWSPLLAILTRDNLSQYDKAFLFHSSLADALLTQATHARDQYGHFAVGLSGGVFQNKLLTELVLERLTCAGFRAYLPEKIPVNDGGLCYGQIIEAAAQLD